MRRRRISGAGAHAADRPATSGRDCNPTTPPPTVSPAEIAAANVRVSMQRKLDSDPDLSKLRLKVVDVVLINKSGNEYKGIATVKTPEGEDHDVPVEVTADKDNTLWETPPGRSYFAQDEPRRHRAPNCPASSRTEPCGEFQDLPVGGKRCRL